MIVAFHTNRVENVLEKVREQHPYRRGENRQTPDSIIEEVRKKLTITYESHLKNLAYQFDLKRILACVEIVSVDKESEIARKASEVAQIRPREEAVRRGWYRLITSYPNPLLEDLLRKLIVVKGFSVLEKDPNVSPRAPFWFISSRLSAGLLKDYRETNFNENLDVYLNGNFLNEKDGMHQESWRSLLLDGKAVDIKKQEDNRILEEFTKITNAPHLLGFGQNYLNRLGTLSEWSKTILEYIYSKFGAPRRQRSDEELEGRFWMGVSEEAKREFQKWVILKEVESFFEGQRADFWRQYVEAGHVADVQQILDGAGFMLDFDHFGVVEFKDVGNAAYIYPKKVFREFWDGATFWCNVAGHFKDRARTIRIQRRPSWDGRIIHSGWWQANTSEILAVLLK